MAKEAYLVARIPWERGSQAPRDLKKIPNAPSVAREVPDAELVATLDRFCDQARKRRDQLTAGRA